MFREITYALVVWRELEAIQEKRQVEISLISKGQVVNCVRVKYGEL